VFSAQALMTHQQYTLQSFKTTFLSRNLDQNMHKNALFFEKIWKIAAALLLSPVGWHSYFLEGVYSANVITVKKEQKDLEIAKMFCFCLSFLILQTLRRIP